MAKKKDNADTQEDKGIDLKPCFIITPIGELNSPTNLKARGLINSVIEPILTEFGFEALPAYKMADSGSINRQVLKSIISNELVIANLTGLNPNVMYELAVRHAVRLPVIIMAEEGTKLPFDINDQRTIFYSDTLLGSEVAKPMLRLAIEAVLSLKEKSEQIDNPIYQVFEEISIIKATKGPDQSVDEYLLRRFDRLENAISRLSNDTEGYNQLGNAPGFKVFSVKVQSQEELPEIEVLSELSRVLVPKADLLQLRTLDKSIYEVMLKTQYSNRYIFDLINRDSMFTVVRINSLSAG